MRPGIRRIPGRRAPVAARSAVAECAGTEADMRAVLAALLVTLIAVPAVAQKAPPRPAPPQKAAPTLRATGPWKDEMAKLMLFELRAQQYADRIASAADKGEGMAVVDYSMRNTSTSLHGGGLQLKAMQAVANAAQQKELAPIAQHHAAAQKAFDDLRAEMKKEYPSRPNVLRLAYRIADEGYLAQGKKPPKRPIIKSEPAK